MTNAVPPDEGELPVSERTRMARVVLGQIKFLDGTVEFPGRALTSLFVDGTQVVRSSRLWTLAYIRVEGDLLSGRILAESDSHISEHWEDGDIVRNVSPDGTSVPFAVNLTNGRLVFQLKGIVNGPMGVVYALRDLWQKVAHDIRLPFEIVLDRAPSTFAEWLAQVQFVDHLEVTIRRPNPHHQFDEIENLIEGARLEKAKIVADAYGDGGLDVEGSVLLQQAIGHVEKKAGYGEESARGRRPGGVFSRFKKGGRKGAPDLLEMSASASTGDVEIGQLGIAVGVDPQPPTG